MKAGGQTKEIDVTFHLKDRLQHELETLLIPDDPLMKEALSIISLANLQMDLNHSYI